MTPFSKIIIHHISDIHIGRLHFSANKDFSFVPDPHFGCQNFNYYIDYLKRCSADKKKNDDLPDILIVSGDLTSYASENDFSSLKHSFEKLIEYMDSKTKTWRKKEQPCIFIVPGNHDLDWSKENFEEKIERYTQFCDIFDGKVISSVYKDKNKSDFFYDFGNDCNLLIYLFNSCSLGGVADPFIKKLQNELKQQYEILNNIINKNNDILKQVNDNSNISVNQNKFEEAIKKLDQLSRNDPGYIKTEDFSIVDENIDKLENHENRIKIAVMHHNPSSIPTEDINKYDTIINSGFIKSNLIERGFDIILHGHRHCSHCSYEEYLNDLTDSQDYNHGLYILGADSLGSKEDCSFLKIEINDSVNAHKQTPPSSLVNVYKSIKQIGRNYRFNKIYKLLIDKSTSINLKVIQEKLSRDICKEDDNDKLRVALDSVSPSMRKLQEELDCWGEGENWLDTFYNGLDDYSLIVATDYLGPNTWLNANYLLHVLRQMQIRTKKSLNNGTSKLLFSKEVFDAIQKTGWTSDYYSKSNLECIQQRKDLNDGQLEFVRILFWDTPFEIESLPTIKLINELHNAFAVPVFVLSTTALNEMGGIPYDIKEFILGIKSGGKVQSSYVLKNNKIDGLRTCEQLVIKDLFYKILKNSELKSLQYLLSEN